MSAYQEKKEARIERYRARAEKNRKIAETNSISNLCGEANTGIPMGQPILVGHHSEKRHRNHLKRIDDKIRKGFEAQEKAEHWDSRANHAESNRQIDSDDPKAIRKLKAKIEGIEEARTYSKAINKILKNKKLSDVQKIDKIVKDLKVKETTAAAALEPDFCGRVGIPAYVLSSYCAEITRLKKRIAGLERISGDSAENYNFEIGAVKVELNDGQIQVFFPSKPSDEIRSKLKRSPLALKWSRYSTAWVRKYTPSTGRYFLQELKTVLNFYNESESTK